MDKASAAAVAAVDRVWSPPSEFDGYEVQGLLGRGGMGEVYLGHDRPLDRPVAIKFIRSLHLSARDQFLTEARAAARLQHPNVISVYRVGEIDGRPYIISEYIRGQSLDRLPRPTPWRRILELGIGLSRGLAAAHRRGILHRDLKPSNALEGPDGEVKLCDFGLAKLIEPLPAPETVVSVSMMSGEIAVPLAGLEASPTRDGTPSASSLRPDPGSLGAIRGGDTISTSAAESSGSSASLSGPHLPEPLTEEVIGATETSRGSLKGTPVYMAPEVLRGEPATRQSDIYSLGAMLYALCAKGPPFQGLPFLDLVATANSSDAPPLREAAAAAGAGEVDQRFCAIVERCLQRQPELRFENADELREALETLLDEVEGRQRLPVPEGNPFRGLLAFEAEHRALFFGRQGEIGTVVERLRTEPSVMVVADSGVGKSSLCRAGVLPLICEGGLDRSRTWRSATLVPGRRPREALLAVLAHLLETSPAALEARLGGEARLLGRELPGLLGERRGAVLFVDQMEELVTLAVRSDAEWVGAALGSLSGSVRGFRLLMTARADYLSRLGELPGLGEEITRAFYLLRPLSRERLREVIVGPARRKGIAFESEELIEKLIESTARTDGGLPLLQFALAELWEARSGDVITAQVLQSIGGVEGALARHADHVISRLQPEQRVAARRILMNLVTLEGTRARRSEEELSREGATAKAALESLTRGRLLVARDTPEGPAYEVAHEALMKGWGTLRRWLEEHAEARAAKHRLETAAAEWLRLGRTRDVLWGAQQLIEMQILEPADIGPREAQFLDASRRALRRKQKIQRALVILIPCLLVMLYAGYRVKLRRDMTHSVNAQLHEGLRLGEGAARLNQELAELRRQALLAFDAQQRSEGEKLWERVREKTAELDAAYSHMGQILESALRLDATRRDVRAHLGDALYARALILERDFEKTRLGDLLGRLSLYDDDGSRMKRWNARARIELVTDPPGAAVTLVRYAYNKRHRIERVDEQLLGVTPLSGLELAPASYRLTLRAPERSEVQVPIVPHRGESLRVTIPLPPLKKVPPGFLYIPAGRFLFGTAADDTLRRSFYTHVPLHEVVTGPYLIGKYEVTYAEWIEYLKALPKAERERRRQKGDEGGLSGSMDLRELGDGSWQLTLRPGDVTYVVKSGEKLRYKRRRMRAEQDWLKMPVGGISRDAAVAYAEWLHATGRLRGARICSELEWERAGRGADGREFPQGDALSGEEANVDETYDKDPGGVGPDEVGSYPESESPFGLSDTVGNAFEWVLSSVDPSEAVARSGGYFYVPFVGSFSNRTVLAPTFHDPGSGIRLCVTVEP